MDRFHFSPLLGLLLLDVHSELYLYSTGPTLPIIYHNNIIAGERIKQKKEFDGLYSMMIIALELISISPPRTRIIRGMNEN